MNNIPDTREENELIKRGFESICGIDEVGLGPWAGPVAFGAVIFSPFLKKIPLKDSKLLSPKKREEIFNIIKNNNVRWGVGLMSNEEIDRYGLTVAKQVTIMRAINNLPIKPNFLLIDGTSFYNNSNKDQLNFPSKFIIKGDNKIKSIAAASIVAKVSRDKIMEEYHIKYPQYSFNKNKGYGTREHQEALVKYGACPIHRKSYKPVKKIENMRNGK